MSVHKELVLSTATESNGVALRSYHAEKEVSISDVWHVLLRRRVIVIGTVVASFIAAVLICIFSTPRYQATAEVQVQKEQTSALGLDGVAAPQDNYSDALQDNMTLQTQANILSSDTLALKVIKDLNLEVNEDFQPKFSPVGWVMSFFTPQGPADPANGTLENSPRRRMNVLLVFGKNLSVKPVAGTRLLEIAYLNPDPTVAATVANRLTRELIDYNFQTRHDATAQTADWLAGQLSDLRRQSQELQTKVAQAQRESGVFTLGGSDAQGREQLYSTVLDKLQQSTAAYTQAQSNRITKGALYEVAKSGDPEAIVGLSGSSTVQGSGMDSALTLIQSLRMQQTTVKAQLAELSTKFGQAYPKLAELRGQYDAIGDSIKAEVQRLAQRTKNDFDVAQHIEDIARGVYLDQKHQADALNDKTIQYTILRQEADESRTLYETLFKQLKQAGVLADFHSNNISIVDPARPPAKPAKPRVLLYLMASLAGGLFVGCCAAIAKDGTDRKINNLAELEGRLGQTPLGILPFQKDLRREFQRSDRRSGAAIVRRKEKVLLSYSAVGAEGIGDFHLPAVLDGFAEVPELLALHHPQSPYVEAVRALRTSLLLSRGGSPPQVILVTSSIAAEGKSVLSLNLAMLLAQQQKKVLIVDGDLRRPSLHRSLKIPNNDGLSSYLAGQGEGLDVLSVALCIPQIPGLYVLPAGPIPPYPAELLGSEQMRSGLNVWRQNFDFIVIDAAPVLPVTDSVVLSSMVDFTLLIARYKVTERQSLDRSYRLLQSQTNPNKIGVVLNAVSQDANTYYQYYGYRNSAYLNSEGPAHEVA